MKRTQGKSARLLQVEQLLLAQSEPITQAEVARLCGVNRSTINRMLADLGELGVPIYEDERGRIAINRDAYLTNIRLTLDESMAVFLAARLLARHSDKPNPHVVEALLKVGLALEQGIAPQIGRHIVRTSEALRDRQAVLQPNYVRTLETLAKAWSLSQKVRMVYLPLHGKRPFEHTFSPYFLEPSAIGYSTYAIGLAEPLGEIRTRKVERIQGISLTGEPFEVPADFDPVKLLSGAWGIWFDSEDKPTTVMLRFSRDVARRVRETRWHPSERVEEDPATGELIWRAEISEVQEIVPWVRQWGADVEVIEPEGLREALVRETRKLAEVYQVMESAQNQTQYYAHSKKEIDKSEWQLLKDHLFNTADLAEKFGADAGVSELARTAALLHDLGKYSKAFQARLDGSPRKVDHATAGARTAIELFNENDLEEWLATMLAYCIAGHHTGLPDHGSAIDVGGEGTLSARLDPGKTKLEDFSAYKTEIDTATLAVKSRSIKTAQEHQGFSLAFMTRMLYSALVDADFQETETYMNEGEKPRGEYASIEDLSQKLNAHLRKFENPVSDINKKRTETLKACIEKADSEQGFFTLTIPTGGGKTLASMAFALNHAVKHGLKRVIYVIPFTTIIEQNAGVFKECLGEQNVLEHHSNFDWNPKRDENTESADDQTKNVLHKLKLASENWDIPIVVTTNVQFFESLFANKSSRCRKLHNLAKSVIIFDEAQMLPREYLDPCMLAVKELVQNYGASAVFCTATQPALDKRLPGVNFTDLVPDSQALFDFYKRVQIKNLGKVPDAELIEKINAHQQVLCIVNTRRHAKGLFDGLAGKVRFHLSTLMCPAHRKETLKTIRQRLADKLPCRVVSTQVMEAGIDVDFPVGYRALAGLDSIIQAAGRVNRNKNNPMGDVFVFAPETPFIKKAPIFIKQGATVAESILRDFKDQPDSKQAIEAYFNFLYNLQDEKTAFDVKKILAYFEKNTGELDFDFKKAAEDFRLIENNTIAVVILYNEEAKELLERAKYHPFPYKFARQLQMYTVNIYENEFEKLQSKGVIETYNETYEVLNNMDYYDENTGLILPADVGGEAVFFD